GRFGDYIEPIEVTILKMENPEVYLVFDKDTYQIKSFSLGATNIQIELNFAGEQIDLLRNTLDLKENSIGKIDIANYSYSTTVTDYRLRESYKFSDSFFNRLRLALFN
ncbi:hypothetical protein KC678_03875, partial [Candidatus Dojkabacteria bacterium]|nr:hypothetical protein [Candidatus Dojkabacteria bacterium]